MLIKKLYIIGNGFDLHHGVKSSYWNFKSYLIEKDNELVEKLEEYFSSDALWSDFEETLAHLDTEQIVEECMDFLEPYSADDWSDAYHHDYQFEVERRIDLITKRLKQRFTEWILQLQLPDSDELNRVHLDSAATFITFNYTNTLERLYKVPLKNILYIHNKAIDSNSTLILGHSRNPKENKTLNELYNDEDTDVRVAEGNKILDDYFIRTYKSTGTIISENYKFFSQLKETKIIYVFGHSLSEVDRPYFQEIIKVIDKNLTKWNVSFYNKKDLIGYQNFFQNLGISPDLIVYDKLNNFDNPQLAMFSKD